MDDLVGTTSVFTDDSGTRRRLLIWAVRGVIAAIVLSVAAVALTLVTHVSLPALGGPLGGGGNASSVRGAADPAPKNGSDADPAAPGESATAEASPTTGATGEAQGTRANGVEPSTAPITPSASPTSSATPGSKANRGAASTDAPRATPTHEPHVPTQTPPGRTK